MAMTPRGADMKCHDEDSNEKSQSDFRFLLIHDVFWAP